MEEGDELKYLPKKVAEYEKFLNERLKTDLRLLLERRDGVYTDMAEYLQLQRVIESLQETNSSGELKTMVDLGCNFYCQALVPDSTHICVAVGFGIFIEFTRSEALTFVERKVNELKKRAEELTEKACQVKARIRIVVDALQELQFSSLPSSPAHRHVL